MEQICVLAKKFGLPVAAQERAIDYCRMFDIKCSNWARQMSSQCLAVVCLDLASKTASLPFDKELAKKLAGLQSKGYTAAYQAVENLLDVTDTSSLQELAVKFGCPDVRPLAEDVLCAYKEVMARDMPEVRRIEMNYSAPLYSVAALYTVCRHQKMRVDKRKFVTASGVSQVVFQSVLDKMQSCIPASSKKEEEAEKGSGDTEHGETDVSTENPRQQKPQKARPTGSGSGTGLSSTSCAKRDYVVDKVLYSPYTAEYKAWKQGIIKQAREELRSASKCAEGTT